MATLRVETTEGISLSHEIAGAGSRAAAGILDLALWGMLFLFLVLLATSATMVDPSGLSQFVLGLLLGGALLSLVLYQFVFGLVLGGATPGKQALGLRVCDLQGSPATIPQHFLRSLFYPVELFLPIPAPIGFLLIAATPRSQRLGDLVAGTIVLREPPAQGEEEPLRRESWSELAERRFTLTPALIGRLTGEDQRYLRRLLARRGLEHEAKARLYLRAARHYAALLDLELVDGSPAEAMQLLREAYLYLRESRAGSEGRGPGEADGPSEADGSGTRG